MFNLIKKVYQYILPANLQERIHILTSSDKGNQLRKSILKYYASLPSESINEEQASVISYLRTHTLSEFPYSFQKKYASKNVEVFFDNEIGLRYVFLVKKRLYFKRSFSEKEIKEKFSFLELEQDMKSPHRYLTEDFVVKEGCIIADVGAAEGNFSLSVIEQAKKVYLFEADPGWVEALTATFKPWSSKVEIISKFVSNEDDEKSLSLDRFFETKEHPTFLKIDVDGAESDLLQGAARTLNSSKVDKIAICTYHKQDDETIFNSLLESKGFSTSISNGYMIFFMDEQLKPPYLRRGLIRAQRLAVT